MAEGSMRTDGPRRSAYRVPTLHRYGGMRQLTAGGTGTPAEGSGAKNPRP